MLGNYFKIAYRILLRQKGYTILNILGLASGIAVFTFIYLYVQSEIYYDHQWSDYQNIYRVTSEYNVDNRIDKIALTPFRLSSDIKTEFPEVQYATRMFFTDPSDINDVSSVTYNNNVYEIPDITLSDNDFFKIFHYKFVEGSPDTALNSPNTMVISTDIAKEIFGDKPAIGKKLSTVVREYTITGVFDKSCKISHHNFDAIASVLSIHKDARQELMDDWYWMTCYSYIKVNDTVNQENLEYRFNNYAQLKRNEQLVSEDAALDGYFLYRMEPVSDVHFNTDLQYDSPTNSDIRLLYIFGIIAAFILLTASINYINLATARSLKRTKEIGVRKVLGAYRKQLIFQHISESVIITGLSFILAMSVVELLIPQFNKLFDKELTLVGSIFSGEGWVFGVLLLLLMVILAVIGGSFPAFILSSFKPSVVLRGNSFLVGRKGKQYKTAGILRKLLVAVQYIVSIGMIISTLIIFAQLNYLNSHELGFDKENVLVINTPDDTTYNKKIKPFIEDMAKISDIEKVTFAYNVPGYTGGKRMFYVGDTSLNDIHTLNFYIVGPDYFNLLKTPLVKGSYFNPEIMDTSVNNFIINQKAVNYLGLENPVGELMNFTNDRGVRKGKIIGVVTDFHSSSLRNDVEPLVFMLDTVMARYILVKYKQGKEKDALSSIQNVWNKYNKGIFMRYMLLEKKMESLYSTDKKMLSLFVYFSIFVIFISSLGLYGLTSFLIQQRTREIGIRRILGGPDSKIIFMLVRFYLRVVLTSGVITSFIVYYLMRLWLETFAYHITISIWYFVGGIAISYIVAILTVMSQALRVVNKSLSESLNYTG